MNTLGERKWHPPKDGKISMIRYLYRLVCIYLFVVATEIRVGRGTSCRYDRSRRAIFPISRMTATPSKPSQQCSSCHRSGTPA